MTNRLLTAAIVILVATFAAHVYGYIEHFYWEQWWFDIPMHLFGGMGVGFLGLWYASWRGFLRGGALDKNQLVIITFKKGTPPWWWSIEYPIKAIAIVAPAWEFIEVCFLKYLERPLPVGYIGDSILDIFLGGVGTLIAWAAFYGVQCGVWRKAVSGIQQ